MSSDADWVLDDMIDWLPEVYRVHAPGSNLYKYLKRLAAREVENRFGPQVSGRSTLGPFGELIFPFFSMGAADSRNLFDLDELIMFSFYWRNRNRYHRVGDIGANIGLHSFVLARCGFDVQAYEPDSVHYSQLLSTIEANACASVRAHNLAVSSSARETDFVRVLGNTTGSHIVGSKPDPYGDLEYDRVTCTAISEIIEWADLLKIDAEGHEKEILCATRRQDWENTDALVEIGSEENARAVYEHFSGMKLNLYAQKTGWKDVAKPADVPTSYRDGSLFISAADQMPWQ